jgi:hypothetical protein
MANILHLAATLVGRTFSRPKRRANGRLAVDSHPYGESLRLVCDPWAGWHLEESP